MIYVEMEAEGDSQRWNRLDGDIDWRDVDEGEPGIWVEVGRSDL